MITKTLHALLLTIWVLFTILLFTPLILFLIDGLLFVFDFESILNYSNDSKVFFIMGLAIFGAFSLVGLAHHTGRLSGITNYGA
jgi:hypothetical protein